MEGEKVTDRYWGIFVKKGGGFGQDHWKKKQDFHEIVARRVEQTKKVRLAGRGNNGDDKVSLELYCGNVKAPISALNKKSGNWETIMNEDVLEKKERKTKESD